MFVKNVIIKEYLNDRENISKSNNFIPGEL